MRFFAVAFTVLALACKAGAAVWYLDNAATGTGAGTSWANAFTNPTQITAAVLSAGDIVYVSGGTTSKTYTNNLRAVEAGTDGNPIIYRNGQTNGHNGIAIFPAFNFDTYAHVWIDGARTSSYSPPASVFDTSWTNNIGFRASRTNGTGMYLNGSAGVNNRGSFVEIGPIGSLANIGDIHGVQLNNLNAVSNLVFEYMWIHDCQNDGINFNSVTTNPDAFDRMIVRNCLIENTGDDGIQSVRNGFTLYRSWLRGHETNLYNGHPDQLQLSGLSSRYIKVVNSILFDKANSLIIGEHYVDEGGTVGPMLIAGNIFANHRDWVWNDIQAYGATFDVWRPNGTTNPTSASVLNAKIDGLYALNNTIYYQLTTPFGIGRAAPTDKTDTNGTRSAWIVTITNSAVRNNLEIDSRYNSSVPGAFNLGGNGAPGSGTNGVYYTTNSYPATHNIIAGPNRSMSYNGLSATNANAHGLNNGTNMPLVETNLYTFVLSTNDTVAKDTGFDLSALTNTYPELRTDLYGNARGSGGGWDIGAVEAFGSTGGGSTNSPITNGLLVAINFDVAPANDDAGYDDWSGNGNHGRHLGYMNAHTASNRCPDQIVWTNRLTGFVETGAYFRRYPDGWDEYNNSGDYLGITNNPSTNELWSMRTATILFWGRYDTPDPSHPDYTNSWNAEGNRRFIGAGYGYPGAWTVGLPSDGGPRSAFRVYTDSSASSDEYGFFTDRVNITQGSPMIGSSTNMRFYVVTWTNGYSQGWLDGSLQFTKTFTNSSGVNVSNLTVRGPSGNRNGMLMIGGDTHNANPLLTYTNGVGTLLGDDGDGSFFEVTGAKQVPNHGWGGFCTMDDVRIYNRVLDTNELNQIMMRLEGSGSSGGGGSTNSSDRQFRVRDARIGRIIRP